MQRNEQRLAALRELSSSVVPLKLRRLQPNKPVTAVSLCDWADREVGYDLQPTDMLQCKTKKQAGKPKIFCFLLFQDMVRRGETLNLKSNGDNKNWVLQTSTGKTRTLPGACFMIPPPDSEAVAKVDRCE